MKTEFHRLESLSHGAAWCPCCRAAIVSLSMLRESLATVGRDGPDEDEDLVVCVAETYLELGMEPSAIFTVTQSMLAGYLREGCPVATGKTDDIGLGGILRVRPT